MRNLVIKIIVSILLITTVAVTIVLTNNNKPNKGDIYNVNIVIKNQSETLNDDYYKIESDQTLFDLLDSNYELKYDNTAYGVRLLGIDTIITDFKTSYIAIYVDDKYSSYGISNIKLYDGIKITFKETKLWMLKNCVI